jgi:16S rRNA (cytosine1402-N4)-methyltransferase
MQGRILGRAFFVFYPSPMTIPATVHVPVMLDEVIAGLSPQPGSILVDGTLGGGGHARALADLVDPSGRVIAFDRDPAAVERAKKLFADLPVTPIRASYGATRFELDNLGIPNVQGVLLDLGLSSDQLADPERGFSFSLDGPLDLRFDPSDGTPASDVVNHWSEKELADAIFQYGEERFSRRIARVIVERRRERPIESVREFAELVRRCVPRARHGERIDGATRTFQALRIVVNDELGILERALRMLPDCLQPGGRAAVISFHSLEDRLVKNAFREDPRWKNITKKPLRASDAEVHRNPRSRSAKLRVAERT